MGGVPPRETGTLRFESRLWRGTVAVAVFVVVGLSLLATANAQEDQAALAERVRELVGATGGEIFVTPAPGSRSTIIVVDTSVSLFLFLSRGSIRGNAIDEFYQALNSGDMTAAQQSFNTHAIMTLRATDYGWNGLGNAYVTDSGAEVADMVYKDIDGVFTRAEGVAQEDIDAYRGLLQAVIDALESS